MGDDYARWFAAPLRHLGDADPALRGILAPETVPDRARFGVTAQFLENAADYHQRYSNVAHFRVLLDDALATLEPAVEPRMILDIGSGSGNSVVPLLERFPQAFVVATDISPQLLAILRDQLAARGDYEGRFALVNVDAAHARYRGGAFDLVVGAAILHHVMDPMEIVDACHGALRPGGAAIFFEPFEMGHAVLHLAYRDIVAEADRRGDASQGIEMLRRLAADYAARSDGGDARRLQDLDDKWMFTRGFFEEAARRRRWSACSVYAIHGHETPLTDQTRVNLRLGMDVGQSALPPWAWQRLSEYERAFSPSARRDLVFEGAVVMRTTAGGQAGPPPRAGWWFDPAEPGQGFFVEIRDARALVVCCLYDDDGHPVWHAAEPAKLALDVITTRTAPFRLPVPAAAARGDVPGIDFSLRFATEDQAHLHWGRTQRRLAPQHAGSPGWAGAPSGALGGCWIEDCERPSLAAVVECLDHRVFVALLSQRDWCTTSATPRGVDLYAGQWLRFRGGQTLGGAYRPPGEPELLGDARLLWTQTGCLVVELPGGRQCALRKLAL